MAYDGFYSGLSTRATVNEILNLAIQTKDEILEAVAAFEGYAEQVHADAVAAANSAAAAASTAALVQTQYNTINQIGIQVHNDAAQVAADRAYVESVVVGGGGQVNAPLEYTIGTIKQFDPLYWTCDGPNTMSFGMTSPRNRPSYPADDPALVVTVTSRRTNDLCGVVWDSEDKWDHAKCAYQTVKDYTNSYLFVGIRAEDDACGVNHPTNPMVLTIEGRDAGVQKTWYVPLMQYAQADDYGYIVGLDFNNLRETPTGPLIPVTDIDRIFFSCVTSSYVKAEDEDAPPLYSNEYGTWIFYSWDQWVGYEHRSININTPVTYPTNLGMSTGYDDSYNMCPERIVKNIVNLGYNGWIDHYVGMSHYYEKIWSDGEGRWRLSDEDGMNNACQEWHRAFYENLALNNYSDKVQVSMSLELFSESCPFEWTQRNWDDSYAATGYNPPSYLITPSNTQANEYLKRIATNHNTLAIGNGLGPITFQLGEWWWWIGGGNAGIFDYGTKVAYNTATGNFAEPLPNVNTTLMGDLNDNQYAYVNFVANMMENYMVDFANYMKSGDVGAKVSQLQFFPTLFPRGPADKYAKDADQMSVATILTWITVPDATLDLLVNECYDWLMPAPDGTCHMDWAYLAVEDAETLQCPLHYLGGFVPTDELAASTGLLWTPTTAREIWQHIFGNLKNNKDYKVAHQYIWAYNQVMRNSITIYPHQDLLSFYFGDTLYASVRNNRPYALT